MAPEEDLYKILGVPRDADNAEIKHAYLALARQHHPDTNQGTTLLGTHFQQINRAYAILSNPENRATYDMQRKLALDGARGRKRLDATVVPPGFNGAPAPKPSAAVDPSVPEGTPVWLDRFSLLIVGALAGADLTLAVIILLLLRVVHV